MFLKREKQIFRALFCRFNKLDGKLVVKQVVFNKIATKKGF